MEKQKTIEQLIKEARLQQKEAAAELISRFQPLVLATARRLAPAPDTMDDLVQEGNLAVLTAIYDYRSGSAPFTWYVKRRVYYAVLYAARCSRRTWEREGISLDGPTISGQSLETTLASEEPEPWEQAEAAADKEAFWFAWGRLPVRQRQVVLGRLQGSTFAAIAGDLKIAPSTAKGAYARAVAQLKKMLGPQVQVHSLSQSISEGGPKGV